MFFVQNLHGHSIGRSKQNVNIGVVVAGHSRPQMVNFDAAARKLLRINSIFSLAGVYGIIIALAPRGTIPSKCETSVVESRGAA